MTDKAKATNYFSHDSNARNDGKVIRLRMKHGAAGYGIYFMILERLREEQEYTSAKDYNMIAFDLRVDSSLVKSVIEDFGLFTFTDDGKCFYSESLKRRMDMKDAKKSQRSDSAKIGAKERWKRQKDGVRKKESDEQKVFSEQKPAKVQTADDDKYIERFFRKSNQSNIEVLMMNLGMKPDEVDDLRKMANEVVAEWKMSEKSHDNYTDWSQHLIATMRIKRNQSQQAKPQPATQQQEPPKTADYQYSGGFGSKDV